MGARLCTVSTVDRPGFEELTLAAGETVLTERHAHRELLVLVSRSVRVTNGGVEISVIDRPGAVIGEMAALLDGEATATVTTLEECRFLRADDPLAVLRDQPGFALEVATTLAHRLDLGPPLPGRSPDAVRRSRRPPRRSGRSAGVAAPAPDHRRPAGIGAGAGRAVLAAPTGARDRGARRPERVPGGVAGREVQDDVRGNRPRLPPGVEDPGVADLVRPAAVCREG